MFEIYYDKKVKLLVKDSEDRVKSYKGILRTEDKDFIRIELENGEIYTFNKSTIMKMNIAKPHP